MDKHTPAHRDCRAGGIISARRFTQMVALRDRIGKMLGQFRANSYGCTYLDRPYHWEGRAVMLRNKINRKIDQARGEA